MNLTLDELIKLTPEEIVKRLEHKDTSIEYKELQKPQSIDMILESIKELEEKIGKTFSVPKNIIENTSQKEVSRQPLHEIDSSQNDNMSSELGGFQDDRDTPEDAYRDRYDIKKEKPKQRSKEELYGLHGERDSVEDMYTELYGNGPQPEPDTAPLYPDALPQKLTAKRASKEAFKNAGNLELHSKNDIITANDGCQYKIVSISENSNRVKLLSAETLKTHSTPYDLFFGVERKFPYAIGDTVIYKDEEYTIDGISPSNNSVLLSTINKYIRISQIKKIEK